ncbi:hypothetical protein HRbin15_01604 [bacterium HR15]|nr:hypothetical protein HRbin15_01604 [bacterium HR15]
MAISVERKRRRALGEHLTPAQLFHDYILPEIAPLRTQYRWVDLFAGKGDLILPLLELVPPPERADFFREHIFMYDIQPEMVECCVQRAIQMGVPELLARQNIRQQDTLAHYPTEILNSTLPVYHITNPPYLYLGYIVKHPETQPYLRYFEGVNEGYQDLYQIALINDLRHGIPRMAYIIPSNFLFGFSNANKIRDDFLPFYRIQKAIVFERELFEYTGVHVVLCFFERKERPVREPQRFEGLKIAHNPRRRCYSLSPSSHYRAGSEFEEFTVRYRAKRPLKVGYYLYRETVDAHPGEFPLRIVDANGFTGKEYCQHLVYVDETLFNRVRANPLFVRTLDTGTMDGRAGLYLIPEVFGADGIMVSSAPYRTHPIQIFLEPTLPHEDVLLLKDYFNLLLEHFREITDSEFMTTYKYSDSAYTRKYLGLSQAKALIETFPYLDMSDAQREILRQAVRMKDVESVITAGLHALLRDAYNGEFSEGAVREASPSVYRIRTLFDKGD